MRPRAEAVEQRLVLCVDSWKTLASMAAARRLFCDADGVDVAGEVEVHLLHRDHLRVSPARGAALDAERGAHRGLADARDAVLVQVRAHGLRQADGRRRLALAERRRVDPRDDDVVALAALRLEPRSPSPTSSPCSGRRARRSASVRPHAAATVRMGTTVAACATSMSAGTGDLSSASLRMDSRLAATTASAIALPIRRSAIGLGWGWGFPASGNWPRARAYGSA